MYSFNEVSSFDPDLAKAMDDELARQRSHIELIASENLVSKAVMAAMGSPLTNKYAEGYPGKRFQAGSEVADKVEELAWKRAKELFGAEHVNIQSYSGSTANYSVFASVLNPGDLILSMRLDQGGHLTHGSPANWVSKIYRHVFYGVDPKTELIDYDELEKIAKENKPKMIIAGASSYSRLIDYERISKIAEEVGAYFMVDMAHIAGLVAAKVIPSPIPYADFVSSSTTKTFCSARSGMVFCKEKYAKILDKGTFPGSLGSLMFNTMAAKTWSFKYAASQEFHDIMAQVIVNAKCLAEELQKYGFRIVSGGTDNHLLVVDLRSKGLTGKTMQNALDAVGITVNKNMIPFDPEKPGVTSGIRIGLTAVSQRGLKEPEIREIAAIINQVAEAPEDEANLKACKAKAEALIAKFPLYPAGSFDD